MNDEELEAAMRSALRSHAADAPLPGAQTAEVAQRRVRTRRRSTVVAGAAATVLAITGGFVVADNLGNQPDNAAAPPVVEHARFVYGGIPGVFGYDESSAKALLARKGLVVTVRPTYTCLTQGRAVRTMPETAAPFEAGDAVTLFVTTPPRAARCAFPAEDALAWQVLDFGNGRGPAPAFDRRVTVYFDGQRSVLTRAEAADPETWDNESALGLLAGKTSTAWVSHDEAGTTTTWNVPKLVVKSAQGSDSATWCGDQDLPDALADRPSLMVGFELPAGKFTACTSANLFQTDGKIDAIVVHNP